MKRDISIILPAKNEAENLRSLLPAIRARFPDEEVIVVDDGSTDETAAVCESHDVRVVSHPTSRGNGAAIKSGSRAARGKILVFMDADGQHSPDDIPRLLDELSNGYDMAVGARDSSSHASVGRRFANSLYNSFASRMTGQTIRDLTSGFRAVKAEHFREFLHLLPNGFSYPTTITMAFFRANYLVSYVPITAGERKGKSHINIMRDGFRFLIVIFRVGTLYSPLKIFVPTSFFFFLLGLCYYLYTFTTEGRFTNMSALLLSTSVLVFLIGLVSEQITFLAYKDTGRAS